MIKKIFGEFCSSLCYRSCSIESLPDKNFFRTEPNLTTKETQLRNADISRSKSRRQPASASHLILVLVLALVPLSLPDYASAQTGKADFQNYCAQCHGENGKGGKEVDIIGPDLTLLSRKNGGKFPFQEVYEVVDGRKQAAAHKRLLDMPLWGVYFRPQGVSEGASEAKVKSRITDLVSYIQSLQEK